MTIEPLRQPVPIEPDVDGGPPPIPERERPASDAELISRSLTRLAVSIEDGCALVAAALATGSKRQRRAVQEASSLLAEALRILASRVHQAGRY
jgi:hypothetical protein